MEGNKCGNVYCVARTDVHIHTPEEKKYIYNNSHINCGNDQKNQ